MTDRHNAPGHDDEAVREPSPSAPDPFDPESLRVSQDFASSVQAKKKLMAVPVRKPDKTWWIRVHPDESYRIEVLLLVLKEEQEETYLVDPKLAADLSAEATVRRTALFTSVNRQGVVFLWKVMLPGPDGRHDSWNEVALETASGDAQEKWVRVVPNMSLGSYDVYECKAPIPDPEWPDVTLRELLRVAFKGRFIDSLDHPVLRQLRGEQ